VWTQMTMVSLSCDEPGCDVAVECEEGDWRGYFSAQSYAIDAAVDQDWDVEAGQPARCPRHARPQCVICDGRDAEMPLDEDGDYVCASCAAEGRSEARIRATGA